ncbi:ricin-type beta-trefoil lectin domain protein [Amycolatopsis saalfeldensis]|uniref:galactosylceramidase n=1 Tax=Amycolatopsis saalfeldensis TaxID=394193 RepID=A0A1H8YKN6_9PSEU|nr:ricin-type beta-trefoil lectin domain protein [Amycolatopsis saalfeldensis]SEP52774.1 O-Glycosyl hydrolase [Amycolatopsis saalfeldensis]
MRRKVLALLAASLMLASVQTPADATGTGPAAVTTAVKIDGAQGGRTFDGIGAISGGGGNSRLLIDYPEPQRSQILDYLFKPGYGADLQLLKLEIGGDANSTDGAEPSIEHTKGAVNCDGGYEWWLAEQAVKRNPRIELYGLAWTAPGWLGGGNFWSQDTIGYLMTWLGCAKQHHLDISLLGGWNERGYDAGWYEKLHTALAANGHSKIKVVGADSDWGIADDMVKDPALAKAVDIVGAHYPCSGGDGGDAITCATTPAATATGKPLWASENGSQDISQGTPALIRSITRGYLDAKMTAYLNWPLLAAITPNLPYSTVGLAVAPEPWSGAYSLGKSTWATAQVTQFTQPGWTFIDSASGYLGGDRANGSYVTLKSPNRRDYSTILETTTATAAQTASFTVAGGLSTGTVHVWATDLGTGPDFAHLQDIRPANGRFSLTLQPNTVYTISTTTGQGKGTASSPASGGMKLPYADDFNGYPKGKEAKYFADMQGSYEVQPCTGRAGSCLRQMAPIRPIIWQDDSDAYSMIGDPKWGNYTVSADVRLAKPGTAELLGRANTQSRPQADQNAYWFRVSDAGAWSIVRSDTKGTYTTIASGQTTAIGVGQWHTLSVTFQGNRITGTVDGKPAGSATDGWWTSGQAGIGLTGYQTAEFDNFAVTPGSGSTTPPTGPITAGSACADGSPAATNGAAVTAAPCVTGSAQQTWTVDNGAVSSRGKCLDVFGQGTADGTKVELWDCNGGPNQTWLGQSDGTLLSLQSGKCLDNPGDGQQLVITTCTAADSQKWALPTS